MGTESLVAMETLPDEVDSDLPRQQQQHQQPPLTDQPTLFEGKSQFLLGRWTCQLQQCLKLLKERIQIFPRVTTKNIFFIPKVEENLRNVEKFCRILLSNNTDAGLQQQQASFTQEQCWNRFCELAANYFRLRLYMATLVFGEVDILEDDDNFKFVRSEYRQMFPKRSDGRGRSLESLPLGIPSLAWFREGSLSGSIFKLLDLAMSLLVQECVLKELDFFEIEDLGMGAGRLEKYRRENVELGSLEEKEATQFCRELAASLLANAIEIDRGALRRELVEYQRLAGVRPAPPNRPLETGLDSDSEME